MSLESVVRSAVAYLADQQQTDGSFLGAASSTIMPFRNNRSQPTIFPSVLILSCLQGVTGAEDIKYKAVQYVQDQMSNQGSWNYWDRQSDAILREPYPDDLDDTACALAALAGFDDTILNGTTMGRFVRLLIAAEHAPGGPYNTWLVDYADLSQWKHVDLAVNANIGYLLSLHGVTLTGLTEYIDRKINNNNFNSDYYVGELPILYFLARWYRGPQLEKLRQKIIDSLMLPTNSLERALLLAAACRVGIEPSQIAQLAEILLTDFKHGHWSAAALYVDPVYNHQQHYGGSKVLTTAFAVEALELYARQTQKAVRAPQANPVQAGILKRIHPDTVTISDAVLRRQYIAMAERVAMGKSGNQIAKAGTLVARAGNWNVSAALLGRVDLASLNGWMAYTIYDDFLDGGGQPKLLGAANIALRRSYNHFMQALPSSSQFKQIVTSAFDDIDSANAWELRHARAVVLNGTIMISKLPNYGSHEQLAQRSIGHSLAASGVVLAQYGQVEHPCFIALQRFFHYFLIARQLNDDAHDWELDLCAGHLSAVVTMILSDRYTLPHKIVVADELEELRQQFWRKTIDEVALAMHHNIDAAHSALQQCGKYLDIREFTGWLDDLEQSVTTALAARSETLQFMKAYETNHA